MSEVIVRNVRPTELGNYQGLAGDSFDVQGDSAVSGHIVAYTAEIPDDTITADGASPQPTKPVAMVVCQWGGSLVNPTVEEVITPEADGVSFEVFALFEQKIQALAKLTGIPFPD